MNDEHFTGTAPHGREEDFHGVHLVFAATVSGGQPVVRDPDGTTDAVSWVPVAEIEAGQVPVSGLVTAALRMGAAVRFGP